MKMLFHILLIALLPFQERYPLKDGRPTSKGIEHYVEDHADSLVNVYQKYIGDTLYHVWIYAENLNKYGIQDSLELGFYIDNEIYISTSEYYNAYELADLSGYQRSRYLENNKFVKATMLHELSHDYFNQVAWEMIAIDSVHVNRSYKPYHWILTSMESFGAGFIEEGVCEYMVEKMGEVIRPRVPHIPSSVDELTLEENAYSMKYKYSAYFLRDFLNENGFKWGIKILIHNPPPTFDEILDPDLFFSRLTEPAVRSQPDIQ
jgi:hypothetical protein